MEKNSLINPICSIRRCSAPARYNYVVAGHPNGDVAASYCAEHIHHRVGMWDDSPRPYSVTVSGPFAPGVV